MSTSTAAAVRERLRHGAPYGQWGRCAPWVAPLVTAAALALATLVLYTSCGAALI